MHFLPRPLSVPNRLEENSDRRGVGNCGLKWSALYQISSNAETVVPLIDMKVLRQVGSKTRCRGRSSYRLETEVVCRCLCHAKVLEIEA